MQEKQYSTIVFGIAFSILLLFAYLFAIERVLFQDASVMIFKIINEKKTYVTNYRFISAFIELPSLIAIKYNLSVKIIVYIYSFAFFIPEIITASILVFVLKDYKNLLVLILLLVVLNNFDFYYTYAEFHKGINLCVLFLSIIQNRSWIQKQTLILSLLGLYIIILFCHPLTVVCILFIFVYLYVNKDISFRQTLLSGILVIVSAILKLKFIVTDYEKQKMASPIDVLHLFKNNTLLNEFTRQLLHHNFVFLILFLVVIAGLIYHKKYLHLLGFWGFSIGYFLLIIAKNKTIGYDHYGEYFFKPIVFFIAVYIMHQLYHSTSIQRAFLMIMVILSVTKIYHYRKILCAHKERYEAILKVMHTHNIDKAIISKDAYQFDLFDDRWASSYESILLDKIMYDSDSSKTFNITFCTPCSINDNQYGKTFIDVSDTTDNNYFKLSKEKYVIIDSLLTN